MSGASYRVAALIISDRAASGEREDGCLPVFEEMLAGTGFTFTERRLCSDEPADIRESLRAILRSAPDVLFTSGGSGCSKRDNTPEVSAEFIELRTPGIDEAIRRYSFGKTPFAIYSRAISGFAGETLIINLPGAPRAVREILEFLLPTLEHPLKLRRAEVSNCGD